MFTGIIRAIGRVTEVQEANGARRLSFEAPRHALGGPSVGNSVAVSGVCLTLVESTGDRFAAELSQETLSRTTLGRLAPGSKINLEPAVAASDALGGHLVTGHVDGVAQVREAAATSGSVRAAIEAPAGLARYIAAQGSITLDGVSLTVTRVAGDVFGVELVPHTLAITTLGSVAAGQSVNLEVDLVARYLERLLEARGSL